MTPATSADGLAREALARWAERLMSDVLPVDGVAQPEGEEAPLPSCGFEWQGGTPIGRLEAVSVTADGRSRWRGTFEATCNVVWRCTDLEQAEVIRHEFLHRARTDAAKADPDGLEVTTVEVLGEAARFYFDGTPEMGPLDPSQSRSEWMVKFRGLICYPSSWTDPLESKTGRMSTVAVTINGTDYVTVE